jgi:hypothetical protein
MDLTLFWWVMATISVIVGVVVAIVMFTRRRVGGGRTFGLAAGLVLVAGWGGFLASLALVLAAGPSVRTSGTLRIELGEPFDTRAELAATCESVVGDPDLLSRVEAVGPGYLTVYVRDLRTRDPEASMVTDFSHPKLHIPDLRDSTLLENLSSMYIDRVVEKVDQSRSGHMRFSFDRRPDLVNYGQWPSTVEVRVAWSCPHAGGPG